MTANEIWALARRLADDEDLHEDYMIRKMGLDPSDPSELATGYEILVKKGLVVENAEGYSLWP